MKCSDSLKQIKRCVLCFAAAFFFLGASVCQAAQYEYKLLPLGSLTSLQSEKKAEGKTLAIENLLNGQGKDGWEVVNIFAVRTTFDPNVFFVVMKRELNGK